MTPFKLIAISSLLALLPMISSCNMKRFTQDDGTLKPIVGMDGTEFYKKKSYTDAIACFKASADQGDAYA